MATKADLLIEVKSGLNIKDTSFDVDLNSDLDYCIKDLYPLATLDVAPANALLGVDGRSFELPASMSFVTRVEVDGDSVDFFTHANRIYLTQTFSNGDSVLVFGATAYTIADYASIPAFLESVIINWCFSKFYAALAGNKRKYNIYVGAAGSAADRDMKDSAQFFKDLGDALLEERVPYRGA